jgi:hypothetical protein
MPLTSDQVVNSLIAFYKRHGADLTYLLGDPIFQSLSLTDRVEAVKQHAEEILKHSSTGISREEKSQIKANTLVSGLTGGMAASSIVNQILPRLAPSMARNRAVMMTGAAGVLTGLAIGAASGFLQSRKTHDARQALRYQLGQVVVNPSDENAIGVFSIGAQHQRNSIMRNALIDRASSTMNGRLEHDLPKTLGTVFKNTFTMNLQQGSGPANSTPMPGSLVPANLRY